MPKPTRIDATISLEVDDVLDQLSGLDPDKIIDLIVELDRRAASWDVTAPLCAHFAGLAIEYEKEKSL